MTEILYGPADQTAEMRVGPMHALAFSCNCCAVVALLKIRKFLGVEKERHNFYKRNVMDVLQACTFIRGDQNRPV